MTDRAQDSRLKHDETDFDVVGRRETSRRAQDRDIDQRREVSDEDRLEMFRQQMFSDALPDLPEIPGYHTCWLTTTNPRDPIHKRTMLGYTPILPDEVPELKYASLKTGEYAGLIGVNEMVAYKLPLSLYHRFMQEAHHDAPLREEGKLADVADMIRANAERDGGSIIEDEGLRDLRSDSPARGIFS